MFTVPKTENLPFLVIFGRAKDGYVTILRFSRQKNTKFYARSFDPLESRLQSLESRQILSSRDRNWSFFTVFNNLIIDEKKAKK